MILKGKAGWDEFLALTQTTEGHIILALVIGMDFHDMAFSHFTHRTLRPNRTSLRLQLELLQNRL